MRLSSYNQLLESVGKEPLHLEKNEVVLYEDPELRDEESIGILEEALKTGVRLQIDGQDYLMKEKVMSYDVVTDNKITLMDGLIVEDSVFDALHQEGNTECYWNAVLDSKIIEKEGLIKSFTDINKELTKTGIDYESYMENMGRYLFYMVWYFFLPVAVAVVSSAFGIQAMTNGLLSSYYEQQQSSMLVMSFVVVILIVVVEWVYIRAVMKNSDRNIHALLERKRDE